MVKKYLIFSILIFFWFSTPAQKLINKQFSLVSYDLEISENLRDEITGLGSYISGIKTYNDPGNDKLMAIFIHNIYFTIKEILEKDLEIEILPINTFINNVKYNNYGYPVTSIRKALRKGYSQYYFKLEVKIESLSKQQKAENPEKYIDISYSTTYPKIIINMTIYSKDGIIPVYNLTGEAKTVYPLKINEYLLRGFDNKDMVIAEPGVKQDDNIYTVFYRATKNLIQDYLLK